MERIGLLLCVLSVLLCSVNCQDELAIEFFMQRVDNSTYTVTEAMVDSSSMERLNIVCRINNIQNIIGFNSINIYRVNKNGNVEHLATMRSLYPEIPGFQRPALVQSSATMQAVGVYDEKNPSLGISVPVASLTCNDGLQYNCSLVYDQTIGDNPLQVTKTVGRNLTVSVQPKDVDLKAFNQSASFPMEIQSDIGTATNMAHFMIGQVVKLTCKANLGTRSNGLIFWKKSNIVAGSGMANYIPNINEREEGQVVANGCQFEKTDSIMYNMTAQDAIRTSNSPLQFQCYIIVPGSSVALPETTMKNFYIKVHNVNEPTTGGLATADNVNEPTTGGMATAGTRSENVTLISGVVVATLVALSLLVTAVVLVRKYRIRCLFEDRSSANTKTHQQPSNIMSHERASETDANTQYCELDPSKRAIAPDTYDTVHGYYELSEVQDARR